MIVIILIIKLTQNGGIKMGKNILRYISSQNIYGTMNSGTIRLTNMTDADKKMIMKKYDLETLDDLSKIELTSADKREIFIEHRKAMAKDYGFDWHKMFMADQVNKNGSYFEITEDYVEANPNGWSDIPEDILLVSHKTPGVVIGHPVADCPVVMMEDKKNGVVAVGHCSAELIDKKLPMMIADALLDAYGTKDEDISIYVGACAGEDWTYDCYPKWAQDNELWKYAIVEENGIFKIDMRKAIRKQFNERNIGKDDLCVFNLENTRTNQHYYSNSVARENAEKFGRHFDGAFYQSEKEFRKIR